MAETPGFDYAIAYEAAIAQRNRYREQLATLQAAHKQVVEAREQALVSLRRAEEFEFRGTTAENGDAHCLVRQAIAALSHPQGGPDA